MRSSGFRRDLELAPGAGFRLRRKLAARIFSALLAVAAISWGVFDLWVGYQLTGLATVALAVGFVLQMVLAELDSWRFEGVQAVHRRLRGLRLEEARLDAHEIRGVEVEFAGGLARAWIELRDGGQVPLIEGPEREVRQVADRLVAVMQQRPEVLH